MPLPPLMQRTMAVRAAQTNNKAMMVTLQTLTSAMRSSFQVPAALGKPILRAGHASAPSQHLCDREVSHLWMQDLSSPTAASATGIADAVGVAATRDVSSHENIATASVPLVARPALSMSHPQLRPRYQIYGDHLRAVSEMIAAARKSGGEAKTRGDFPEAAQGPSSSGQLSSPPHRLTRPPA